MDLKTKLKPPHNYDVGMTTRVKTCFLLDITASMEPWIQASKNKIREIINSLPADTKVAFVGYRDYDDAERFVIQPFGSVDDLLTAIRDVHADGGNDIAEDVAGGLYQAQQLNWDDADVKTLIHIADAPAHGHEFHEAWVSDDHPEGDAEHHPCTILQEMSHHGIDYTFVRVDEMTDTMTYMLAQAYESGPGKFKVIDLYKQENHRNFARDITRSITLSIERYSESQDPELP